MTELKKTEYKTIELAEDDEDGYGTVIGNIVMDKSKMLYAEIVDSTICNHEELANARAFLDEVEESMETGTVHNILNGCCEIEMLPDNFWSVMLQKDIIIKQQSITIEELKDQNIEDLNELYQLDKAEFLSMKSDYEIILQNRRNRGDKLEDNIKGIEAELSTRKKDYEVLEKVVDVVKNWDDGTGRAFPTLYQILDLLVDYTDAPEGLSVPPIDSGEYTVVSGNTPYTVEIDIRCE